MANNEPNVDAPRADMNPPGDGLPPIPADDPLMAELNAAADGERLAYSRFNPDLRRVPRKSLADFTRDVDLHNVLISGRWGVRGTISMHVSTTGTGKSILQTQSALCFNRGVECCGLRPVRPFRSWVVQSEDDDDRVALDRDDVAAELSRIHPGVDWNEAIAETRFLDFTGLTGAAFIETLNNELFVEPPDAVIINPFNAYFGGNLKDGADASAFFKGGEIRRKETEGLEAVLKRHKVWGWIFSHTGKPPTAKELRDWLNDPFSAYKMCGASEIADAVRSIITFLKCPNHEGVFTFTAGKNGNGLKWTDANGNPCTRALFQWGEGDRHYWRDVGKELWQDIWDSPGRIGGTAKPPKPPPPPPRDETPVVLRVFKNFHGVVGRGVAEMAVRDAVNAERRAAVPVVKDLSRDDSRNLLDLMDARGVIRILPKGTGGARGAMCGLPDVVQSYLNPPLIDVPPDLKPSTPGSPDEREPPMYGRSKRFAALDDSTREKGKDKGKGKRNGV